MAKLDETLEIRGNLIKNRIVMEPMYTFSFRGDNGCFYGRQHLEHYRARAKGGAGLIILQATHVEGACAGTHKWTDGDQKVLGEIAEACHAEGAAVMMQLACGDVAVNDLTGEEIKAMQADMIQAAVSADELGYDGAEFHFAHGFTLCKFIDAAYNRRTDSYGGSTENRIRILAECLPEIRSRTRKNFMLSVRMGEYLPESRDGMETAKAFEAAGIDLLNISFGMKMPDNPVPDGFILSPMAYSGCRIKQVAEIPVIAAGGLKTEEQVRFLIRNDYADLAGIGTAMLADAEFANHIIGRMPVNKCQKCAKCFWFTDHLKCPVIK